MQANLQRFAHQAVAVVFLALVAVALAQSDAGGSEAGGGAVTVGYYAQLPSEGGDGGSPLATLGVDEAPDEATAQEARFVQITYDGRAYLFAVAEGGGADVAVEVTGASGSTSATPQEVADRLAMGFDGDQPILLTSRREGEINIVTGIYAADEIESSQEVTIEADSRIAILNGGNSIVRTVAEGGATFADVRVATEAGEVPLLGDEGGFASGAMAQPGEAPADAQAGDGEAADGEAAGEGEAEAEADVAGVGDVAEGAADAAAQAETGFEFGLGQPLE